MACLRYICYIGEKEVARFERFVPSDQEAKEIALAETEAMARTKGDIQLQLYDLRDRAWTYVNFARYDCVKVKVAEPMLRITDRAATQQQM